MNSIITLDGYAASGKSTLAKLLAKKLGTVVLSTGEAHRINAFNIQKNKIDFSNEKILEEYLTSIDIKWHIKNERLAISIDGIFIEDISNEDIGVVLPQVTRIPNVCNKFTSFYRSIDYSGILVAEGHGLGNGIFPYAKLKFFCEASEQRRAERRAKQCGKDVNLVRAEMTYRDRSDMNRDINPIVKTEDMIVIDTENNNVEECLIMIERALIEKNYINFGGKNEQNY